MPTGSLGPDAISQKTSRSTMGPENVLIRLYVSLVSGSNLQVCWHRRREFWA